MWYQWAFAKHFFSHALNKTKQQVVGKVPTKVNISMTISNSATAKQKLLVIIW
jgi:hypothetical protein